MTLLFRVLLGFWLLVVVACGDRPKPYVIGVSQCSEDSWRAKLNEELLLSTHHYDREIRLQFVSADDDDQTQIRQIEAFVDAGVDLLIVSPNQAHTISPAIARAYDKGIPIILFDRKTDTGKYTAFIGADNYKIGQTLGHAMAAMLRERGNIVEVRGLRGASPTIERHRGFAEAIAHYPHLRVVATAEADWTAATATAQVARLAAQGLPRIDGVFGHNDRMAAGARQALLDNHTPMAAQPIYIGVDALPSPEGGMVQVRDGLLTASYLYPTRGDLVMDLAMNILQGRPYPREQWLEAAIVTRDNAQQLLLQHQEYVRQQAQLRQLHGKIDTYLARYAHQQVYLVLTLIILVLFVGFSLYVYRSILHKRALAQQATQAKLQFFTDVSHEFRTPLTLIAAPIEQLLEMGGYDPTQQRLLTTIQQNTTMLLRLVGEILDFRKLQNGKIAVRPEPFDLAEALQSWHASFVPMAAQKGIALHLDATAPLAIVADKTMTERVCYNLLSNALKYTPKGGRVVVRAQHCASEVEIAVSDTGVGIGKRLQPQVFERFFQAHSHGAAGTGIGLAIVKAFVEQQGGRVAVESEVGKGSTFRVWLPKKVEAIEAADASPLVATKAPDTADQTTPAAPKLPPSAQAEQVTHVGDTASKPLVLIAEDSEDVRTYLATRLATHYTIVEASNGREAFQKAMKCVPDLIITDWAMPEMTGLELCQRLKAEAVTHHIPIIMLTALTQDEHRTQGYEQGADAYITKPFSGQLLLARMRNLIDSRERLKQRYAAQSTQDEAAPAGDADSQFLAAVRAQIHAQLADSALSVETLSTAMNLSRVQLYRKVKALTGATPVELIRLTRLKKAEHLLKTTAMTVSEIAYKVGFSSPSYFAKCYKDHYGRSPKRE